MNWISGAGLLLAVVGLLIGVVAGVWLLDYLMRKPASRIWLSDWVNWSRNALPRHTEQWVRHGRWVAVEPKGKDE